MLAMSYDAGCAAKSYACWRPRCRSVPANLAVRAETTNRRSRVLPYSATTGELYGRYLQEQRALSRERGRLFLSGHAVTGPNLHARLRFHIPDVPDLWTLVRQSRERLF